MFPMVTMLHRGSWSNSGGKNQFSHASQGGYVLVCMQSHIVRASHASESGPLHHDMSHTGLGLEDRPATLVDVPRPVVTLARYSFGI